MRSGRRTGERIFSPARRKKLRILAKIDTHNAPFIMHNKNNKREKMVPEAQDAMNRFKMEAANEVGVNLKQGYNGDLTSRQAGSVGGQMVKKMIKSYEESMK